MCMQKLFVCRKMWKNRQIWGLYVGHPKCQMGIRWWSTSCHEGAHPVIRARALPRWLGHITDPWELLYITCTPFIHVSLIKECMFDVPWIHGTNVMHLEYQTAMITRRPQLTWQPPYPRQLLTSSLPLSTPSAFGGYKRMPLTHFFSNN
jgi:hypothetical protein